ncbi:hypothetical protein [Haloferula sargassicola]|uniref:Uncharacterized protein n=1 Tax=Haloferula sargassicola TaxID=490096 RepID=A0ABP9UQS2_9BACT
MTTADLSPLPLGTFAAPAAARPPLPAMPDAHGGSTFAPPAAAIPMSDLDSPRAAAPPAAPLPANPPAPGPAADPPAPDEDFTDADLLDALAPLVRTVAPQVPAAEFAGDFEALLRTSLRRTLAEHTRGPFEEPDLLQRLRWRFDALVSSRSYEEVVEHRSHRFHVEEVYLLDDLNFSLISYASANLSRHLQPRRVMSTVDSLSSQLRTLDPAGPKEFQFEDNYRCVLLPADDAWLVAFFRGRPDSDAIVDLDCILRRIQSRFGAQLARTEPLLEELQPLLEECLLIHSPLAPVAR